MTKTIPNNLERKRVNRPRQILSDVLARKCRHLVRAHSGTETIDTVIDSIPVTIEFFGVGARCRAYYGDMIIAEACIPVESAEINDAEGVHCFVDNGWFRSSEADELARWPSPPAAMRIAVEHLKRTCDTAPTG